MLKIKSRSLVINQPLAPELKQHLTMLVEKEEEQIKMKLEKQHEKQSRIDQIEKSFVEWADRKEGSIRVRLQKSVKNKEEHLSKIVKRCKDHEKFLNDKFKNFQTKKKAGIKEAWKKAEEFNHDIENYHQSKHFSRELPSRNQKTHDHFTESRFIDRKEIGKDFQKEYASVGYNNQSKVYGNKSRDYWAELNQSIKQLKSNQIDHHHLQDEERDEYHKGQLNYKLKETIDRFKQQSKEQEEQKIHELGMRLARIEKSRLKKVEMHKKKREGHRQILETEYEERKKKDPKHDRSQRIHSETIMREKRVTDWSQANRQKREEFLQAQLQQGTEYLQVQKIKYIKTNLARKVADSAIEKKLYFQRLNH